jgi:hypothetical protein
MTKVNLWYLPPLLTSFLFYKSFLANLDNIFRLSGIRIPFFKAVELNPYSKDYLLIWSKICKF